MSGAKFVEDTGIDVVRRKGSGLFATGIGRSPGGFTTNSTRGGGATITGVGRTTGAGGATRVSVTAVSTVAVRFKLGITCSSITY